jgi:metal-responsive CopG/Arc/MetJ family transcriptional regulator
MSKTKISITLSSDLLSRIDEAAHRARESRSAVIENWLRRAARTRATEMLREQTIEYYDSITPEERAEDEAVARATAEHARRIRYDD